MNDACHGIAKFHFLIVNRVSADHDDALSIHSGLAAGQYLAKYLEIAFLRIANDRKGGKRTPAHSIDVIQRIYRRNLSIYERIISDRREKIDGLHQRRVVRKTKNTR